jgi:hypothetical protein
MRLVISGVMVVLLGGIGAAAAIQDGAFAVGVLRRDAVVVPFASYDGAKWRADWPEPERDPDVPVDLRSVPKRWWGPVGPRDTWQAWIAGEAPRLLRVLQPDWVTAYAMRQIGLRTDYRASERLPPPDVRPYPTDGLAVSPPRIVEPIQIVAADDPERARLAPVVTEWFNRTERSIAKTDDHPIRQADREQHAPAIEAVYAHGGDPRVVYVEAAREYHANGEPDGACRAMAFGDGWFVRGRDEQYTPVRTFVTVQDCDRPLASYMLPLGAIRASGRTFWLVQFSGWDCEIFEVAEITAAGVNPVVRRREGGC